MCSLHSSLCHCFLEFGNAWGNENVFTAAEGIIWFRYHNYLASKLQEEYPSWSDEELFQYARKRVVATLQVQIWVRLTQTGL